MSFWGADGVMAQGQDTTAQHSSSASTNNATSKSASPALEHERSSSTDLDERSLVSGKHDQNSARSPSPFDFAALDSGVDSDLICPYCHKTYRQPRLLQCLHALCEDCIIAQLERRPDEHNLTARSRHNQHQRRRPQSNEVMPPATNNSAATATDMCELEPEHAREHKPPPGVIRCPVCKQDSQVGNDIRFVSNLLIDYVTLNQLDTTSVRNSNILCESCKGKEQAVARCQDCSKMICKNCVQAHCYMKCFDGHVVVNFDDMTDVELTDADGGTNSTGADTLIHRDITCPLHNQETYRFTCSTCNKLVCNECVMCDHRPMDNHQLHMIDPAMQTALRTELAKLIAIADTKVSTVNEAHTDLHSRLEGLKTQVELGREAVHNAFDRYKDIVDEHRHKMLHELEQLYGRDERDMNDRYRTVANTTEKVNDAVRFAQRLLKYGSSVEMFLSRQTVTDQLLQLVRSLPNNAPAPNLQYRSDDSQFKNALYAGCGYFKNEVFTSTSTSAQSGTDMNLSNVLNADMYSTGQAPAASDMPRPYQQMMAQMLQSSQTNQQQAKMATTGVLLPPPGLAVSSAPAMPGQYPLEHMLQQLSRAQQQQAANVWPQQQTPVSVPGAWPAQSATDNMAMAQLAEQLNTAGGINPVLLQSLMQQLAQQQGQGQQSSLLGQPVPVPPSSAFGAVNGRPLVGGAVLPPPNPMQPGLLPMARSSEELVALSQRSAQSQSQSFGFDAAVALASNLHKGGNLNMNMATAPIGTHRAATSLAQPNPSAFDRPPTVGVPQPLGGWPGAAPLGNKPQTQSNTLAHSFQPITPPTDEMHMMAMASKDASPPTSDQSSGDNPPVRNTNMQQMHIRHRFGTLGPTTGQFNSPHGFCLGFDEEVVIADTNNHRVQVFNKNAQFLRQFGVPGKDDAQLWYPRKVAVFSRGTQQFYIVCDRGNERSRMQIYTREGQFVKKIAIRYVDIVAGLAVDHAGNVIAVDSVSPTIFKISVDSGELLKWFDCSEYMKEPSDVAVSNHEYFVCDFKGHCVCVFSEEGKFTRRIGRAEITSFPNGIDISDAGDVLVGDSHGNRFHVAIFKRSGEFETEFECPSIKVSRCCGLRITSEGLIVTLAKNNHYALIMNTLYVA